MSINLRRSFLMSIVALVILLLANVNFLTALGLGLTLFVFVDFTDKLGKTIPILEVTLLIACFQWIIGAYLDYITEYKHYKYYMYVPEETYMNLVVPSLYLFAIPIYWVSNKINYPFFIERIKKLKLSDRFGFFLIIGGFIADILGRFAPASIGFIFFLASGIKFVGLLCLFFNNSNKRWIAFCALIILQFALAVRIGLFHYLILWLLFMLLFIAMFFKVSFTRKLVLVVVGFIMLFVLQTIKNEFRKNVWSNYSGSRTELFFSLFWESAGNYLIGKQESRINADDKEKQDEVTNRLNQGWIISRIMSQIPARKPYLNGETIENAIYSSIIPRVLSTSKSAGGGGRITFEKLTGFELLSASMGTGVLGEAYGNYGVAGAYLFMFLWGLFLAMFYKFLFNRALFIHSLPLWLPIIFFQVIKAETDLFTVLNHLVKSTIFVFGFIYIIKFFLKARL